MAGPRPRKHKLLPQARALYQQGLTQKEVAAALGVVERTIARWSSEDRALGRPWTRATDDDVGIEVPESAADRVYRRLERRLEELIGEGADPEGQDAAAEDRALKVCRVMEFLRRERDELSAQLEAMRRFASFCVSNLSEEEMLAVRKAVCMFIEEMRRAHR